MDFFYSKFWNKLKQNERLYKLIHNSIGVKIRQINHNKRIKVMKEGSLEMIFKIHDILADQDCVYFVDFGTLLGFVRDGKPIEWDYDIDFGICFKNDYGWTNLQNIMKNNGFNLVHEFNYCGTVTEQTYNCNGIMVDFFCHFQRDSYSEYYVYYRDNKVMYKDRTYMSARVTKTVLINSSIWHKIEGGQVLVPQFYEHYLEEVYGSNWRIPIQDFEEQIEAQPYPPNRTVLKEFGRLIEY